ncbi:MAG: S8 family serine peptidase [Chloroflexi bacterium]|nr:S8 family serine peptidase [Chloroflexota bacterium]
MRKPLRTFLMLSIALVLMFWPLASVRGELNLQAFPPGNQDFLSEEVLSLFADGMTVDEFLMRNRGPIPHALERFADRPVSVIIEMDQPSLAEQLYNQQQTPQMTPASVQRDYANGLLARQSRVVSEIQSRGGLVMGQFTRAYNGVLARISASEIDTLRSLPGVRRVVPAKKYHPALSKSVSLIRADQVWNLPQQYRGEGITIAVIDTGVDYTHAAFGGPGTVEAYANNDPNVIEEGTFPTAKVIGGFDFAGTNYDGQTFPPEPDPDPLDEHGHGTHVASIAAGVGVPDSFLGPGVAPDALIYALKVFGARGVTELTINALEWAMDPNQDGDISDHVDVVNLSLGSDFGPNDTSEPENIAVNNLTKMGVIVVAASGNAGDVNYITGAPATADAAISVASSTTGWLTSTYLEVAGVQAQIPYKEVSYAGGTGEVTTDLTLNLVYAGNLPGAANDLLCTTSGLTPPDLSGSVLVVQRGECFFLDKINNASALGAAGIIIFNSEAGGDELVNIGDDAETVDIPAVFIGHSNGLILVQNEGAQVTIWADQLAQVQFGSPDEASGFTSRGSRGFDSGLKPDLSAPGSDIFAADVGSGSGGISFSGTSMSTPHVSGLAALMRQAHPTWSVEDIKAAMMNSAVDLGAAVPVQGAGRVDALASIEVDTVAVGDSDLVSLNWGLLELETSTYSNTKSITVRNLSPTSKTYNVTAAYSNPDPAGASISVPSTVTVGPNSSASVPVSISLDVSALPSAFGTLEEYYGTVILTNAADPTETLRVPFYFVPRPYTRLVDLGSQTRISNPLISYFDTAVINLRQSGHTASSLTVLPVYAADGNETTTLDSGDLRFVGLDYLPVMNGVNDVLRFGFNTWGPIHVPQPIFVEVDLYMDIGPDGSDDLAFFNFNMGAFSGVEDTNEWVVLRVDLNTGAVDLASPIPIYADFNSGYMEWYLPAAESGLGDIDSDPSTPPVTSFAFQAVSFDYLGNDDITGRATFDYAYPPFIWSITETAPLNSAVRIGAQVTDLTAYEANPPRGVMVVDLFGRPGAGQAYYWPVEIVPADQLARTVFFLPIIGRDQ